MGTPRPIRKGLSARRIEVDVLQSRPAVEIYGRYLRRLFALGVRAIKVDFGEQAPLDAVYHDGTPGSRMHNLYPLLYNRTVAEITAAATGERIIWARSAWAGSQRYPLHWGGDSSANWHNLIPQMDPASCFGVGVGIGFGIEQHISRPIPIPIATPNCKAYCETVNNCLG